MREILFRGKRKDNGEWIEGYYLCIGGKYHYILTGILDISWEAKIVCQSTDKTSVNFYKIINNKIDLSTVTTHTLTSLGLLNNSKIELSLINPIFNASTRPLL